MKFSSLLLATAWAALTLTGCENNDGDDPTPETGEMSIEMEHVVGADALRLNPSTTVLDYVNQSGEWFNVTHFHYFVSNIRLKRADGTEYVQPDSYYLVEESVPTTKTLTLKDVPVGDYTGISFMVGVDAAHNTSGTQQGVLAPGTDTFWSWTTGYIFLKMEGYSPLAPGNHVMQFHIGGFEAPNNAIRTVAPALPAGVKVLVRTDHSPEVHMKVDLLSMFGAPNPVQFGTFAIPHGPSANAVKVADNYAAGMFEIEHVHAN